MTYFVTGSNAFPHLAGRKILQLVPQMGVGGVERGAVQIASALTRAGARPYVASADGPLAAELKRSKTNHFILPLHLKNPLSVVASYRQLKQFVVREKIDLIHARSRLPAWLGYRIARTVHIPFVTTFHGTYNFHNEWKKKYNGIMALGDHVIAVSDHIARHIDAHYRPYLERQSPPTPVHTIHRGVDISVFDPGAVKAERMAQLISKWGIDPGNPILFMPARLTRWKGHFVVMKALSRLKHLSFSCIFAGDAQGRDGYVAELMDHVRLNGLEDRVLLVGSVQDMAAAYALSTCVLHASTDPEAFGRTIAEASAMGRYVLASDLGAPREIIRPGITGDLYPAGDDAALSLLIQKVLSFTPGDFTRIQDDATRHTRAHFTVDQMTDKTLSIYNTLLSNGLGQ